MSLVWPKILYRQCIVFAMQIGRVHCRILLKTVWQNGIYPYCPSCRDHFFALRMRRPAQSLGSFWNLRVLSSIQAQAREGWGSAQPRKSMHWNAPVSCCSLQATRSLAYRWGRVGSAVPTVPAVPLGEWPTWLPRMDSAPAGQTALEMACDRLKDPAGWPMASN